MDSATTLALAQAEGYSVHALSFHYGQRHVVELEAARRIARTRGVVDHREIGFDLAQLGGSSLTGHSEIPRHRPLESIGQDEIPSTYVPARNTIFLSFALAWCEVIPARDIFIGVNAVDYSGYPDCRPEFIAAFERMARLGTRGGREGRPITIHTPLIHLTKAEIIRRGLALGVDYGLTTTCYDPDPDGTACGACDACQLRLKGFAEAGITDPIRYRAGTVR
jgi:7-cyano-7-deazaguanine synthase